MIIITKLNIYKSMLALTLTTIIFSSCTPIIELNKRGLVKSLGIDYKNGIFTTSFQLFDSNNSSSSSGSKTTTVKSYGSTIMESMKKSSLNQEKKIYYPVTEVIIIGKNITEHPKIFQETINFLNSIYISTPNIPVVISKNNALDIISSKVQQNTITANFINNILTNSKEQGYIPQITYLTDIISSLYDVNHYVYIPIINRYINNKKTIIYIDGLALFHNCAFTGALSTHESQYISLIQNNLADNSFNIHNKKLGLVSLHIDKKKVKISSQIKNNIPHFSININLKSSIIESSLPKYNQLFSLSEIKNIESTQYYTVKNNLSKLIDKTLRQYQSDIFHFTNNVYLHHRQYFEKNQKNWNSIVPKITYSIKINNEIIPSVLEDIN